MKKATVSIKCYKSNATVFAYTQDGRSLGYVLDFEGCDDFTIDENMAGFRERILDRFGNVAPESLDSVLATLRIRIDSISQ